MKIAMRFKFRRPSVKRLLRFVLLLGAVAGITIAITQPSAAQFSLSEGLGQGNRVEPPPEVNRYGNIETIVVRSPLSNRILFTIASPTVNNRQPDTLGFPPTFETVVSLRSYKKVSSQLQDQLAA